MRHANKGRRSKTNQYLVVPQIVCLIVLMLFPDTNAVADPAKLISGDPDFTFSIETDAMKFRRHGEAGFRAVKAQNFAEAERCFTKCIALFPTNAFILAARASANLELKKFPEAIADANKALEGDANQTYAYFARGSARYFCGQYKEALNDLNNAIALDPVFDGYVIARAKVYLAMTNYDAAIRDFDKCLTKTPVQGEVFKWRGQAKLAQGSVEEVIDDCNKAITSHASIIISILEIRAEAYCLKKDWGRTIKDCSRLIELGQKTNSHHFVMRATAYWGMERYEDVVDDYSKALAIEPKDPASLANVGMAYAKLGQYSKAIECCKTGVELYQEFYLGHNNLAWLLAVAPDAQDRNAELAMKHANIVMKLTGGTNAFAVGTMAAALAESGRFKEAVDHQKKAIAMGFPQDAMFVATNSLALYEQGKPYRETTEARK